MHIFTTADFTPVAYSGLPTVSHPFDLAAPLTALSNNLLLQPNTVRRKDGAPG
jgi:hypothetical protein